MAAAPPRELPDALPAADEVLRAVEDVLRTMEAPPMRQGPMRRQQRNVAEGQWTLGKLVGAVRSSRPTWRDEACTPEALGKSLHEASEGGGGAAERWRSLDERLPGALRSTSRIGRGDASDLAKVRLPPATGQRRDDKKESAYGTCELHGPFEPQPGGPCDAAAVEAERRVASAQPVPPAIDNLDAALATRVAKSEPTPEDDRRRNALLANVTKLLADFIAPVGFHSNRSAFRGAAAARDALSSADALTVSAFGSASMKMHSPSSDVDCSLEFRPDVWRELISAVRPRAPALFKRIQRSGSRRAAKAGPDDAQIAWLMRSEVANVVAKVLRDAPQYVLPEERNEFKRKRDVLPKNVQCVAHARVPIVKFVDARTGLEVDISIASNGVAKSKAMGFVLDAAPPQVRQVARLFKLWAKRHQVNDPVNGTLNSYAVLNLVLWGLQQSSDGAPALLPPLSRLIDPEGDQVDAAAVRSRMSSWCPEPPRRGLAACFLDVMQRWNALRALWGHGIVISAFEGRVKASGLWAESSDVEVASEAVDDNEDSGDDGGKEGKAGVAPSEKAKKRTYTISVEDPFDLKDNCGRSVQSGWQSRRLMTCIAESAKQLRDIAASGASPDEAVAHLLDPTVREDDGQAPAAEKEAVAATQLAPRARRERRREGRHPPRDGGPPPSREPGVGVAGGLPAPIGARPPPRPRSTNPSQRVVVFVPANVGGDAPSAPRRVPPAPPPVGGRGARHRRAR